MAPRLFLHLALRASVVAAVLAAAPPARAQSDEEKVIEHVKAAQSASNDGNHKKAVKEYQAAYKLVSNPSLLIPIALEYREMGNNHSARKYLRQFLKEAPPEHKKRDEAKALLAKFDSDKSGGGKEGDGEGAGGEAEAEAGGTAQAPAKAEAEGAAPAPPAGSKPSTEGTPEAALEFTPEAVPLQLDDREKPIEKNKLLPKNAGPRKGNLPTADKSAPADTDQDSPIYAKWWFWTLTAAVVAGGVAIGLVVTRPGGPSIHPCPIEINGCYGDGRPR